MQLSEKPLVLIVDDEPLIRRVLRHTLENAGYAVLEAIDGGEAMAMLDVEPLRVSAVLTDITMPHMDGLALAEKLHHEHPDVPVVLASGKYTEGTLPPIAGRISGFLDKPYSRSSVLAAVATAVSESAPDVE